MFCVGAGALNVGTLGAAGVVDALLGLPNKNGLAAAAPNGEENAFSVGLAGLPNNSGFSAAAAAVGVAFSVGAVDAIAPNVLLATEACG